MMNETRLEKDSLGVVEVPAGAMYGAQTQRAVENYPISGMRMWGLVGRRGIGRSLGRTVLRRVGRGRE